MASTLNPASASRIEVVRGPATLLYGANAIGGLVNAINDTIPMKPVTGRRALLSPISARRQRTQVPPVDFTVRQRPVGDARRRQRSED